MDYKNLVNQIKENQKNFQSLHNLSQEMKANSIPTQALALQELKVSKVSLLKSLFEKKDPEQIEHNKLVKLILKNLRHTHSSFQSVLHQFNPDKSTTEEDISLLLLAQSLKISKKLITQTLKNDYLSQTQIKEIKECVKKLNTLCSQVQLTLEQKINSLDLAQHKLYALRFDDIDFTLPLNPSLAKSLEANHFLWCLVCVLEPEVSLSISEKYGLKFNANHFQQMKELIKIKEYQQSAQEYLICLAHISKLDANGFTQYFNFFRDHCSAKYLGRLCAIFSAQEFRSRIFDDYNIFVPQDLDPVKKDIIENYFDSSLLSSKSPAQFMNTQGNLQELRKEDLLSSYSVSTSDSIDTTAQKSNNLKYAKINSVEDVHTNTAEFLFEAASVAWSMQKELHSNQKSATLLEDNTISDIAKNLRIVLSDFTLLDEKEKMNAYHVAYEKIVDLKSRWGSSSSEQKKDIVLSLYSCSVDLEHLAQNIQKRRSKKVFNKM